MPLDLVTAAVVARAVMPPPVCQATACPLTGTPWFSTSAWVVHEIVDPAASERAGVSAASTGGVPPLKCACTLDPLVSMAITTEAVASTAATFIVALPSPVVVTVQVLFPQPRVGVPLATV